MEAEDVTADQATDPIKLARAIADKAWEHYQTLREKAINAEAEWARLVLLDLAGQQPSITGFSWSTEYSSDDEGGYFETASGYIIRDDGGKVGVWDVDLEDDLANGNLDLVENALRDPETIRALCGTTDRDDEHQVTVAELRQRSFA
jgi:hypothetical protein